MKRPVSVTIIGCVFVAAGLIGLAYHATEFNPKRPLENEAIWVAIIRLIAVACGVYILRGSNWARWLGLGWIAYHVIPGSFYSPNEIIMHTLLFAVFAFFLFRPPATRYFRGQRTEAT